MVDPPVLGAVQETTEEALAYDVAVTVVGLPGTVAAVTLFELPLARPVPAALVAWTLKV